MTQAGIRSCLFSPSLHTRMAVNTPLMDGGQSSMNTTTKDALGSEHPSFSNAEAYLYTFLQSVSSSHPLSTYSDACWGSQMGHTVREGSFLPLFNNHSISGRIFFWSDGFIAGPIVGLEKTSLSSCEAEICSTDEACKLRLTSHNLI